MELNGRHMSVTPQNVGKKNPRSGTHEGTPREYIDGSEDRKGTEYRNDLGKYEEQILELNRELERSKSVEAEQSRIIQEKEKMIQDLTTRYDTFTYNYSVYPCNLFDSLIMTPPPPTNLHPPFSCIDFKTLFTL